MQKTKTQEDLIGLFRESRTQEILDFFETLPTASSCWLTAMIVCQLKGEEKHDFVRFLAMAEMRERTVA